MFMRTGHNITLMGQDLKRAYSEFVNSHPHSLVYHSIRFIDFITDLTAAEQQVFMVMDEREDLKAVLPLLSKEGSLGRVYNSLPYYGSHGGILSVDEESERGLCDYYNKIASANQTGASTIVGNPLIPQSQPAQFQHNFMDHRIGQLSSIAHEDSCEEKLMESFHQKTRNMIRKAARSGFSVGKENNNTNLLELIHRENMEAINGSIKSSEFFKTLQNFFRADIDYQIWVARKGDEAAAALLLLFYKDTVEYYVPATKSAFRSLQPMSLLIFEAMKDASSRGYKLWNWGGTWESQEGVHRFKKRWGSKDIIYKYYTQVNSRKIYETRKEDLLEEYTNFFVIPFKQLN